MKTKEDLKKEIQKQWEIFEKRVVGDDAGDIQRSEMRMAFISGMVILSVMLKKTDHTADEINAMFSTVADAGLEYTVGNKVLAVYDRNKEK